jgi:hypothetical protein
MKVSSFKLHNRTKNNEIGEETIEKGFFTTLRRKPDPVVFMMGKETREKICNRVFRFSGSRGSAIFEALIYKRI